MIDFNVSNAGAAKLRGIVTKAAAAVRRANGPKMDRAEVHMSLVACHLNGCRLDLDKLSRADDFNLLHDVLGIDRHISRETGKLMNCFLPRCALPIQQAA